MRKKKGSWYENIYTLKDIKENSGTVVFRQTYLKPILGDKISTIWIMGMSTYYNTSNIIQIKNVIQIKKKVPSSCYSIYISKNVWFLFYIG